MEINWVSQVPAAFVALVVGFIWYNPKVFGGIWMRSIGMTMEDAKGANMAKMLGLTLLFAFMMTIPLNYIVNHDNHTFGHGAFHGAFLGIMVALPIIGTNALYELRSWTYILVNAGFWIVTLALMGGVLRIMQ